MAKIAIIRRRFCAFGIIVPKTQRYFQAQATFAEIIEDMTLTVKYKDIIERCEMLSSFEAEGRYDANGKSRYPDLHIGEADLPLLTQYIKQAQALIEQRMERMIADTSDEYIEEVVDNRMRMPFDKVFVGVQTQEGDLSEDLPIAFFYTSATNRRGAFYHYMELEDMTGVHGYEIAAVSNKEYRYPSGKDNVFLDNDGKEYAFSDTGKEIQPYSPVKHEKVVGEGFTWNLRTDTRWNGAKTFAKLINESISSYAMAAYLKGKLDDRVPFYEALHANTLDMAVKNIFTKQPPKK